MFKQLKWVGISRQKDPKNDCLSRTKKILPCSLIVLFAGILSSHSVFAEKKLAFGKGNPIETKDLPTGQLRQKLEALPSPAKVRALNWLNRIQFTEADLPYLHVDGSGAALYIDPEVPIERRQTKAVSESVASENISFTDAFSLHSKPGASRVVHLDMDGHTVTGTAWNNSAGEASLVMKPYDSDGDTNSFSQAELNAIAETWKRIAEDFAPFDIDVTTEAPISYGPDVGHILVTPKTSESGVDIYSCGCGGVAYVDVWGIPNFTAYQPALVFTDGVGTGPHNIAEAASHELGHNLGLSHDGTATLGYYTGHGTGNVSWAPIMGVGYYSNVTQWSKGEYSGASQNQDDISIIVDKLTYANDDHENTNYAAATALEISNGTDVVATNPVTDSANNTTANKGIIERADDVDLFYLDVGTGLIDLMITPDWVDNFVSQNLRGTNLDIKATLFDEAGVEIASNDSITETESVISVAVGAGRYILAIEGVGSGDPLATGYSAYGSLGHYYISGTVPEDIIVTLPPLAPTDLVATLEGSNDSTLTWTDPDTRLEANESGYRILRQFNGGDFIEVATVAADSTTYTDIDLVAGDYQYQVQAYNDAGESLSNITEVLTVLDNSVVTVVDREFNRFGDIDVGSYIETNTVEGSEVLIEEVHRDRSKLKHTWRIRGVEAADVGVLTLIASAPANTEGDNFKFTYSVGKEPFVLLGTLESGTGEQNFNVTLPAGTSGKVRVRVVDTNRKKNNTELDTVEVSYIGVSSSME